MLAALSQSVGDSYSLMPIEPSENGGQSAISQQIRKFEFIPVIAICLFLAVTLSCIGKPVRQDSAQFKALGPDLFLWADTCNVYVLRDGDAALLIDLGDGSILDKLPLLGVQRVEWVLFTHHHREQCQGAARLEGATTRVAAPAAERELFEKPSSFRKMDVKLGDSYTIHGSSYVRPPVEPIHIDSALGPDERFIWRGQEFLCLATPGNSPGALSYLLRHNGRLFAFSGDVMLSGARMHTWFDTEWDYGFGAGIRALQKSVSLLRDQAPGCLLPSHGPSVQKPGTELEQYAAKLKRFEELYLRGYDVEGGSVAYQDKVSVTTAISNVVQVSPHIYKFKRPNFWPNFGLILADSGHALVVDCGLLDQQFLDYALEGLRQHHGLKSIDAAIITHMHGDHFLEAPHLREKWGAKLWALDRMADVCEHPERFDYAAPIQAYGKKGVTGVRFDRLFRPGEKFRWENYEFTVDWMPGQTEFALCLHGQIDGRLVAFTGDNLFADPDNPEQNGHEAMVAHNSAILEEGYIYGAEYLHRLKPGLLIGGHSFVMDHPAKLIERYRHWAYDMQQTYRQLSSQNDYRYGFDPFWVRAYPYRVTVQRGADAEIQLNIRNFRRTKQTHSIRIHTPPDLTAEPSVLKGTVAGQSRQPFPVRLRASRGAKPGIRIVAFDVTVDGTRLGEWFDCIVDVPPSTGQVR